MIWDSEPGGRKRSRMSCTTEVVWLYSARVVGRLARRVAEKRSLQPYQENAVRQEAHVVNFYKNMRAFAAVAAVAAVIAGTQMPARAQAAPEKKYKDGEYDMYNQALKDLAANSFDKAISDVNAWSQKYPESDYKAERTSVLIQAYNGAKQYSKAL